MGMATHTAKPAEGRGRTMGTKQKPSKSSISRLEKIAAQIERWQYDHADKLDQIRQHAAKAKSEILSLIRDLESTRG